MGEKKDRERFCIKFNARDSAHRKAMEILEKQGPRGKAQFIANAVLCYAGYLERPEISQAQTPRLQEEEYVKQLVREVLASEEKKRLEKEGRAGSKSESRPGEQDNDSRLEDGAEKEMLHGLERMDTVALSLISATMSEFRNY